VESGRAWVTSSVKDVSAAVGGPVGACGSEATTSIEAGVTEVGAVADWLVDGGAEPELASIGVVGGAKVACSEDGGSAVGSSEVIDTYVMTKK
jgi:hypothetical protein